MTYFDAYKSNIEAAAGLMANYASCVNCPMLGDGICNIESTGFDDCKDNWKGYLSASRILSDDPQTFSAVLAETIPCEHCPVYESEMCNGKNSKIKHCGVRFTDWLESEFDADWRNSEDVVNKPEHYQLLEGVQVIDVIREVLDRSGLKGCEAFCLGNVIKYVLRADQKNGVEDYKKAAVYLNWLIETIKK